MIPATIITGFLGSGKTTLIQAIAAQAQGRRLAFLINEFGEQDIDGNLLKGCGIDACQEDATVVELPNGCICCTVANDFIPAMEAILEQRPDHILIETSGLALPAPLVQAFDWPEIRGQVQVDGVVMVADAEAIAEGTLATDPDKVKAQQEQDESIDHVLPIAELFEDQLSAADIVVLSKTEHMSATALAAVEAELRGHSHIEAGVEVIRSPLRVTDAGVEAESALAPLLALGGTHGKGHVHDEDDPDHNHDDFSSVQLAIAPIAAGEREALLVRMRALLAQPGVIRVKGVVEIRDSEAELVVQGIGNRLSSHFRPRLQDRATTAGMIVAIGSSPLPDLSNY